MNDDMTYYAGKQDFGYLAQPSLWRTVDDFRYEAPSTGWALRNQAVSLAILVLWVVAILAITPLIVARVKID
jgi:hypothetical protein